MTKTIIITGASDGIGRAAARELHAQGHTVVLVGRTRSKTEALASELDAPYYLADFSKLSDVRALARKLKREYKRIDVLANNAGGIFDKRTVTEDGFELTFQVNYLAPFLLTGLLLGVLIKSGGRVINTASSANRLNLFDPNDLNGERRYSKWIAYGNAKLEDIMFARELTRRYGNRGITSASFHPGVVSTGFARELKPPLKYLFTPTVGRLVGIVPPEKGADTLVWLATSEPGQDWTSGGFYYKRKPYASSSKARDTHLSSTLWNMSEDMLADELDY